MTEDMWIDLTAKLNDLQIRDAAFTTAELQAWAALRKSNNRNQVKRAAQKIEARWNDFFDDRKGWRT